MANSSFLDPDPKLLQLQKHFCRFLIWDVQFFMMHVFFIICLSKIWTEERTNKVCGC